ncbi:RNA polymerase sigma factor [Luteococcus peritonei]|uniref:RNA polymerase sigma factor n=1 Tax=Luteococcus peritonei TaxID=88874 RepID=A0ABW4RTE7_9ACTN
MSTDEKAGFEAMYDQTAQRLMAYCLRHAGAQSAEDAVAETYAIAWRKRDQLPPDPLPWLIVTARNTISAQRRKDQRQGQTAQRLAPLEDLATASPELTAVNRQQILQALSSLSEDDREALLLIAWDGLSTRDAARVLGTTPGALRVRIHRARARLRTDDLQGAHHA